ncbi:DNA polymerase III subunit delta' [Methylocapsa polymorpha]|uniref:DNA polymerase III subunit delta n=1 Tax=Methylocapsa polymorpha TaxID=3080828 RepID=A0ABZ0HRL6_9HYPH|nr:DNA polymerase III subunit delta' [Methylocapsa sp. RX1]
MAPRPRASATDDAAPEADRYEDAPHPREIYALFGHAEAEGELLQSYRSGRLPQAFIIGGPPGVGKATLAWRLARFLLANPEPASAFVQAASDLFVAEDDPIARQVASLAHPDLFLLRRAWNEKTKKHFTDIRVDDVRRAIHMFQQAAGRGGYRICLVDSAEDLNPSGANALLKLIEEPPPRSLFLIVAHKPNRVLATLRSRSSKIALRPLGSSDIAQVVTALGPPWSELGEAELKTAIARGQGSVHDVLRLLNSGGVELDANLHRMLDKLPAIDWRQVHALADRVAPRDNDDYDTMLVSVFDWLDARVRRGASLEGGDRVRQLAPYAEVWEKVAGAARETETLNLDRRPLVFSIFADLAAAARASSS